jgi:hypothetical protein
VLDVVVGAEAEVVVLELGRRVHPAALVAAERAFLVVARDDVLPQLGADLLHEVAAVPEHGVVAQQGVSALHQVVRGDPGCGGERQHVTPFHP